MQQFSYSIRCIKGSEKYVADVLSHMPVEEGERTEEIMEEFQLLYMKGVENEKDIRAICKDMRRMQK